eukprot:TRINITY_DN26919_c0_g1_i1.p1 TRINITY_DN26919_c0_g1~~TRINITY_DN26919_c0_g1_i1.p1  ORF type:complete len:620 (+),score=166.09 TRINITY_DN26919_c0_g1_i1:91-1860(+)
MRRVARVAARRSEVLRKCISCRWLCSAPAPPRRKALLRFEPPRGGDGGGAEEEPQPHPVLHAEAEALAQLPGPLRVAAFVGSGRTGKSTLAGAVLGAPELFPAADTKMPVTEGIDWAAVPDPEGDGTVIVLDCEGSDNPLAHSRRTIGALALMVATTVVSVGWGRLEDSHLDALAKVLATRELLRGGSPVSASAAPLLCVVNGARFSDQLPSDLDRALELRDGDRTRNDARRPIAAAFPSRALLTVPVRRPGDSEGETAFADAVSALRRQLLRGAQPLRINGALLSGVELLGLLRKAVQELRDKGWVEPEGVHTLIIRENVQRSADAAYAEWAEGLPCLSEYDADFARRPAPGEAELAPFDSATAHLGGPSGDIAREVRGALHGRMRAADQSLRDLNTALGLRVVRTEVEERERHEEVAKPEQRPNPRAVAAGSIGGATVATGLSKATCALLPLCGGPVPAALIVVGAAAGAFVSQQEFRQRRVLRRRVTEARSITHFANGRVQRGEWSPTATEETDTWVADGSGAQRHGAAGGAADGTLAAAAAKSAAAVAAAAPYVRDAGRAGYRRLREGPWAGGSSSSSGTPGGSR